MDLLVLHITQSDNFDNTVADFLANPGKQPHRLYEPGTGRSRNFIGLDTYAKSLKNLPGGVETNKRPGGVAQLEVMGRVENLASYSDGWYANLAAEVIRFADQAGVPKVFCVTPGDRRLSLAEWSDPNLKGILGHINVPENDHTDGWFPRLVPIFLGMLAPTTPQPDPKVIEVQQALNAAGAKPELVVDGFWGPKTADAILSVNRYQQWRIGMLSGALDIIEKAVQALK